MSVKRIKYNPNNKPAWLQLRNKLSGRGTPDQWRHGSSDAGTIMNMNPYQSKTEFYYHCIDWIDTTPLKGLPMYRGEVLESVIFEQYWKFYNPDEPSVDAFLENVYSDKDQYRKGRLYNYTVLNDKYPFSYSNPDYQIFKNKYTPSGFLEVKAPTSRSTEKFESGIPPGYLFQGYHQMMMCEVDYVEIFMVNDATYPEVFGLHRNNDIIDNMDYEIRSFGELVLKGKEIVYNPDIPLIEKEQMLSEIAPPNTGEDHLTDFYKEQHKLKLSKVSVEGNDEQLDKVLAYLERKAQAKEFDKQTAVLEQDIRALFVGDIGTIEFPPFGNISWFQKFNCPSRIYKNYHAL